MEKAGVQLYADIIRYYGVDLAGLVENPPRLTPFKAWSLVTSLDPESLTACMLRDDMESYGWDLHAALQAEIINSIRDNTHTNVQVRTKKKIPAFDRVTVPGTAEHTKKNSKPNSFASMARKHYYS